jgi:hypothetical protein
MVIGVPVKINSQRSDRYATPAEVMEDLAICEP